MKENDFYVPIIEEGKEPSLYILWSVQQECARDVMVIVAVNGHGDKSSNPGQDCLNFIQR